MRGPAGPPVPRRSRTRTAGRERGQPRPDGPQPGEQHDRGDQHHGDTGDTLQVEAEGGEVRPVGDRQQVTATPRREQVLRRLQPERDHEGGDNGCDGYVGAQPPRWEGVKEPDSDGQGTGRQDQPDCHERSDAGVDKCSCEPHSAAQYDDRADVVARSPPPGRQPGCQVDQSGQREQRTATPDPQAARTARSRRRQWPRRLPRAGEARCQTPAPSVIVARPQRSLADHPGTADLLTTGAPLVLTGTQHQTAAARRGVVQQQHDPSQLAVTAHHRPIAVRAPHQATIKPEATGALLLNRIIGGPHHHGQARQR